MYDYALCHVKYTIPLALLLHFASRPISTRRSNFRTALLIAIATVSTTPWDSYLIANKIWTYPTDAIIGPRLFLIPAEEYFFFVIQTYITSSLYAFLSRPVVHSVYLPSESKRPSRLWQIGGDVILIALWISSLLTFQVGGSGTYLSLILLWCLPFMSLLWTLAYTSLVSLPWTATILPIALPTLYLWLVDTLSLKRGTWSIESGTKLGIYLWPHLEIEEAIFFLVTNVMIVFGHVACDLAFAVCDTFPELFPEMQGRSIPSIYTIIRSITLSTSSYPKGKIEALKTSLGILSKKSKSFSAASILFEGRLRLDLLSLYAICRVADDLIDEEASIHQATQSLAMLQRFFSHKSDEKDIDSLPPSAQAALSLWPSLNLPNGPMQNLLDGFNTDLQFQNNHSPISSRQDLRKYAENVASSVAELAVLLSWRSYGCQLDHSQRKQVIQSAINMGVALQYVNIARDVPADLSKGRIYLPDRSECLKSETQDVSILNQDRLDLLDEADALAKASYAAIAQMPAEARIGLRAACAVYLEVGKKVRLAIQRGDVASRATVSKWERVKVLYKLVYR